MVGLHIENVKNSYTKQSQTMHVQWHRFTADVSPPTFRQTQQTRYIPLLLDKCWASVVDAGPTFIQQ